MEEDKILRTTITEKYVAFWGGVFSNFYPCAILVPVLMGNTDHIAFETFKSSEQYFMWQKAIFFKDYDTADEILKAETPKEAKALGRKVRNYDDGEWDKVRKDAMFKAVMAKFSQNQDLRDCLLDERLMDKHFVEGSPYDKIWGVGISWDDPKIADEKNWKGQNLLGKTLDAVRNALMEEKEQ